MLIVKFNHYQEQGDREKELKYKVATSMIVCFLSFLEGTLELMILFAYYRLSKKLSD